MKTTAQTKAVRTVKPVNRNTGHVLETGPWPSLPTKPMIAVGD